MLGWPFDAEGREGGLWAGEGEEKRARTPHKARAVETVPDRMGILPGSKSLRLLGGDSGCFRPPPGKGGPRIDFPGGGFKPSPFFGRVSGSAPRSRLPGRGARGPSP